MLQYLCNCDALGDMDIDQGILKNKKQLPVTKLNYGGSSGRFSWILYQLGFLRCHGKSDEAVYPSEQYQYQMQSIEDRITNNENNIDDIQQHVSQPDYYFKYRANGYVAKFTV